MPQGGAFSSAGASSVREETEAERSNRENAARRPPQSGAVTSAGGSVAPRQASPVSSFKGVPEAQVSYAETYGKQYGVDPSLLLAIAWHETAFGTLGAGRQGFTLGYGYTDSGPVGGNKYVGVENQYKYAAKWLHDHGATTPQALANGAAAAYATDPHWEQGVLGAYNRLTGGQSPTLTGSVGQGGGQSSAPTMEVGPSGQPITEQEAFLSLQPGKTKTLGELPGSAGGLDVAKELGFTPQQEAELNDSELKDIAAVFNMNPDLIKEAYQVYRQAVGHPADRQMFEVWLLNGPLRGRRTEQEVAGASPGGFNDYSSYPGSATRGKPGESFFVTGNAEG